MEATMNAMNTVINGSESLHENAPTLASSAMLGELNISNWVGRKLDKRASKDVVDQNHAATGVANVNKNKPNTPNTRNYSPTATSYARSNNL